MGQCVYENLYIHFKANTTVYTNISCKGPLSEPSPPKQPFMFSFFFDPFLLLFRLCLCNTVTGSRSIDLGAWFSGNGSLSRGRKPLTGSPYENTRKAFSSSIHRGRTHSGPFEVCVVSLPFLVRSWSNGFCLSSPHKTCDLHTH